MVEEDVGRRPSSIIKAWSRVRLPLPFAFSEGEERNLREQIIKLN